MTKKKGKMLERLAIKSVSAWNAATKAEKERIFGFGEEYKGFLRICKTEREFIAHLTRLAEKEGFAPIEDSKRLSPGEKVYTVNKNKSAALAVVGALPIENGMRLTASHIDCPRIDLKQRPISEDKDTDLVVFKTHYYGGIKKYQWVNVPLALHGRIMREDGTAIDLSIGEDPQDPVFVIPDLLPHLSRKVQGERKLFEGIKGEELNVLVGSIPLKGAKDPFKTAVLIILNERYGIVEEDLISAELMLVPSDSPRDIGLDRSMIGAYGQDDRACAYTTMRAIFDIRKPERTALAFFFDKEEVGSVGATGAQSSFLAMCVSALDRMRGGDGGYTTVKRALSATKALSADVDVGMDPTFKDVHEPLNAARLGRGIVISKFGGVGGKGRANDASAEFMHCVRTLFNAHRIPWQSAELGKVDEGGGGTVANYLSSHNMDIVDCGPPVLSMHSPYEISSKIDIYHSYRAYRAFLRAA